MSREQHLAGTARGRRELRDGVREVGTLACRPDELYGFYSERGRMLWERLFDAFIR